MTTIYKASLETQHWDFEAYGSTAMVAERALHRGIEEHCRRMAIAPRTFKQEFRDSIVLACIEMGACYRDREKLLVQAP